YLYAAPVQAASESPAFLDPRGGSVVTVTGAGFLPSWSSALGGSRVLVRGLPASGVSVQSMNLLTAVAPAGSFGPAEVTVVSADGLQRSTAPNKATYGLPFAGDEKAEAIAPTGLTVDPSEPLLMYAAAGASANGNQFAQPYTGPLTGGGLVT